MSSLPHVSQIDRTRCLINLDSNMTSIWTERHRVRSTLIIGLSGTIRYVVAILVLIVSCQPNKATHIRLNGADYLEYSMNKNGTGRYEKLKILKDYNEKRLVKGTIPMIPKYYVGENDFDMGIVKRMTERRTTKDGRSVVPKELILKNRDVTVFIPFESDSEHLGTLSNTNGWIRKSIRYQETKETRIEEGDNLFLNYPGHTPKRRETYSRRSVKRFVESSSIREKTTSGGDTHVSKINKLVSNIHNSGRRYSLMENALTQNAAANNLSDPVAGDKRNLGDGPFTENENKKSKNRWRRQVKNGQQGSTEVGSEHNNSSQVTIEHNNSSETVSTLDHNNSSETVFTGVTLDYNNSSETAFPGATLDHNKTSETVFTGVTLDHNNSSETFSKRIDPDRNNSSHADLTSWSCRQTCGYSRVSPCSCDVNCFAHKTCCEDVEIACPSLEQKAREILGDALVDSIGVMTCDPYTNKFIVFKCTGQKTPMVPLSVDIENDFLSIINSNAVVYDTNTGIVYKNRTVYHCYNNNTGESLVSWTVAFPVNSNVVVNTPISALKYMDPKDASFFPRISAHAGHSCHRIIDSCKDSFAHLDPDGLCGKFISYYVKKHYRNHAIFGNRHCFHCNMNTTDGGMHKDVEVDPIDPRQTFLSLLMDFTKTESGLKINLNLMGIAVEKSGWKELICKVEDSHIPLAPEERFVNSAPPQCHRECGGFSVGEKCLLNGKIRLILRHPPNHFNSFNVLGFVQFISCYLSKANLQHGDDKNEAFRFDRITLVSILLKSNEYYNKKYRIVNENEFFVIELSYLFTSEPSLKHRSFLHTVFGAVGFWYIRDGHGTREEDGVLYLKSQGDNRWFQNKQEKNHRNGNDRQSQSASGYERELETFGESGDKLERDDPRNALTGLVIVEEEGKFNMLSPSPSLIRWSGDSSQRLARCYGVELAGSDQGVIGGSDNIMGKTGSTGILVLLTALFVLGYIM